MKRIFYFVLFVALTLSCSKKDSASLSEISYENAIESQIIKFQLGGSEGNLRNIELTDHITNGARNHQIRNWGFSLGRSTDWIPFDPDTETIITYTVHAGLPREQSLENHAEFVELHFGKVEEMALIDSAENGFSKYLSNELFRKELLKIGKVNPTFINFSYQRTYWHTSGFPKGIDMHIDNIEAISGHEDKIFVSGSFNGNTFHGDQPGGVPISNGFFKVILENQ